ncbi:MAG: sugar phosphate nucleotidyltransferase [Candidatus Omnitrophica bacterium]|nr:sugar phosphate nucleotidyltransferase [Candidatus Omnitrophota bacterium]
MNNLYALIMAGGKGSRLWPKSINKRPKHSLCFDSSLSLLQTTFDRVKGLVPPDKIFVVTTCEQEKLIRKQLSSLKKGNLIIEPEGKNTLPCILLGAFLVRNINADSILAVFPSDHIIEPRKKFVLSLKRAAEFAERKEKIVIFGVKPDYPETGYGYIKTSDRNPETLPCRQAGGNQKIYKVERFIEKPDLKTAEQLFKKKNLFWNAGIFAFKVSVILEETSRFAPSVFKAFKEAGLFDSRGRISPGRLRGAYKIIPSLSIDHAVLEKSSSCFMIKTDFSWSDLGSWESVSRILEKDASNNLNIGENMLHKTSNSIIINEQNNHLVATMGLNNIIVIHTPSVTLVKERSGAQRLKELVLLLEKNKRYKRYI